MGMREKMIQLGISYNSLIINLWNISEQESEYFRKLECQKIKVNMKQTIYKETYCDA